MFKDSHIKHVFYTFKGNAWFGWVFYLYFFFTSYPVWNNFSRHFYFSCKTRAVGSTEISQERRKQGVEILRQKSKMMQTMCWTTVIINQTLLLSLLLLASTLYSTRTDPKLVFIYILPIWIRETTARNKDMFKIHWTCRTKEYAKRKKAAQSKRDAVLSPVGIMLVSLCRARKLPAWSDAKRQSNNENQPEQRRGIKKKNQRSCSSSSISD